MSDEKPPYVSTEHGGQYKIWQRCSNSYCFQYHGPIAICSKRSDADHIVKALTKIDAESDS